MSLEKDLFDPWVLTATLNITSHKWTRLHPDPTSVFPSCLHLSLPLSFSSLVSYWNTVQGNHSCSVSNALRLLIVKHKFNAGYLPFPLLFLDRNYPLTERVFFLPFPAILHVCCIHLEWECSDPLHWSNSQISSVLHCLCWQMSWFNPSQQPSTTQPLTPSELQVRMFQPVQCGSTETVGAP